MESTCKPSIFGIFKSQISSRNGSASNRATARVPVLTVRISGLLGSCANISRLTSSQAASSSKIRILWCVSIPFDNYDNG